MRTLLFAALLAATPGVAPPPPPAAEEGCPICDGAHRIPCPKCRGEGRYCATCRNSGSIECPDCEGKGRVDCPRCGAKGWVTCPKCSGMGRYWVPKRRVWGREDEKKGGLRRVIPAHWERCERCKGKGRLLCARCEGKKTIRCDRCRGKGSIACPTCGGRKARRPRCRACEGRGWIPCPACLLRERAADADRPPGPVLRDLHEARGLLARTPAITPLLAVAHIADLRNPYAITVLREALRAPHRWVRALALEALLGFDARDLAEFGGAGLVRTLIARAKEPRLEIPALACAVLEKIARRYPRALSREAEGGPWRFDPAGFPKGRELPPLDPTRGTPGPGPGGEAPRKGSTGVAAQPPPREKASGPAFGAESPVRRGLDLVWVIDCSASVARDFDRVRAGARQTTRVLAELIGNVRAGLIAYRDRVEGMLPLDANLERFREALLEIRAEKGGDIHEGVDVALRAALREKTMGPRPDASWQIIAMGDMGPVRTRAGALLRLVRRARADARRLSIHCVKVGAALRVPGPAKFWDDLAAAGGGRSIALARDTRLFEDLCLALAEGIDEARLRRILRLIARVEGW